MASDVQIAAAIVNYAAEGLRDADLLKAIATIMERAETHLRHQAGHALVAPS